MEAAQVPWRPLGELFVSRGLITQSELETALAEQAATGKRLGEILVDNGLVSGPELTSVLMDQLGLEVAKEEGYGSGLWSEIKRRHRRTRNDDADEDGADLSLLPDVEEIEPEVEPEPVPALNPEPELVAEVVPEPDAEFYWEFVPESEPELAAVPESEPLVVPEPDPIADDPELEQELEEIKAEYTAVEREPEPEPEPESEPEPELPPAAEAELDPEPEPALELVPDPGAVEESEDAAALRAELAEARAELEHLQEMLADAMTALAALIAEAAADQHAG